MKIEIKKVDEQKGILQITTLDERWYTINNEFYPSVTWIAEYYPKGIGYFKWLANKGWDEAEALKVAAGDKGSKVHQAIALLIEGETVNIDDKLTNPTTGEEEELTPEEYECIMSFVDWHKEQKDIKYLAHEEVVYNIKYKYAGTLDIRCQIDGQLYIIDIKTSQNIWPSHEIQLSAYYHTDNIGTPHKLAILQVGYRRNKKKFKFTEIPDQYELFLAARTIWEKEAAGIEPKQKDYPLRLSLK